MNHSYLTWLITERRKWVTIGAFVWTLFTAISTAADKWDSLPLAWQRAFRTYPQLIPILLHIPALLYFVGAFIYVRGGSLAFDQSSSAVSAFKRRFVVMWIVWLLLYLGLATHIFVEYNRSSVH